MPDLPAHTYIAPWESFYVIVGSSAAALTGLQFVVMALISETNRGGSMHAVSAFGTPNVVHFCAALLISAILSAPWHRMTSAAIGLVAAGVAGVFYAILVVRRARSQPDYKPVLEDWIWHGTLPFGAYGGLLVAAILLDWHPESALFVIAGAAILLVFVGIHNAWDTVTYIAIPQGERQSGEGQRAAST
jgi:hypothetical protein